MLPGTAAAESEPVQQVLAGASWRFKDFVSRIGVEAAAAAGDSTQRARFEGATPQQPVR